MSKEHDIDVALRELNKSYALKKPPASKKNQKRPQEPVVDHIDDGHRKVFKRLCGVQPPPIQSIGAIEKTQKKRKGFLLDETETGPLKLLAGVVNVATEENVFGSKKSTKRLAVKRTKSRKGEKVASKDEQDDEEELVFSTAQEFSQTPETADGATRESEEDHGTGEELCANRNGSEFEDSEEELDEFKLVRRRCEEKPLAESEEVVDNQKHVKRSEPVRVLQPVESQEPEQSLLREESQHHVDLQEFLESEEHLESQQSEEPVESQQSGEHLDSHQHEEQVESQQAEKNVLNTQDIVLQGHENSDSQTEQNRWPRKKQVKDVQMTLLKRDEKHDSVAGVSRDEKPKKKSCGKKEEKYSFDLEKKVATTFSPAKVIKVLSKLTDEQKKAVEEIGFGGILRLGFDVFPKELMHDLVVNYCHASNVQTVGSDKYLISKDDVYDILCLPIGGKPVVEISHAGKKTREAFDDVDVREKWRSHFGLNDSGGISMQVLGDWIGTMKAGDAGFKRFFVMYVICTFLSPTSRSCVDFKLVKCLEDVDQIRGMDWCGFVLDKLNDAVRSFKTTRYNAVNGCLYVLLMCYMYRYPLRGHEHPCHLPLIANWDEEELSDICNGIKAAGFGKLIKTEKKFPLSSSGKLRSCRSGGFMNTDDTSSSSSRLITFEIPDDLATDAEIDRVFEDPVEAMVVKFKRNIDVITRAHFAGVHQHIASKLG